MTITKDAITQQSLPRHVAIIMDGNGRWAQAKGKPRVFGHKKGVESVRNARNDEFVSMSCGYDFESFFSRTSHKLSKKLDARWFW